MRNDLPPEAEAPIIELETADTQFAAMYLGFSSDDLDQNQITDYLTRVVQPQAERRSAACSAPTSSATARSPCASGSSPTRWRRSASRPPQVREALAAQQLPLRARPDQGLDGVGEPHRQHRPADAPRSSASSWSRRQDGVVVRLGDVADVVLGAENYDEDVRFNGETATFMGVWVLPTANSLDVIGRVREAMPEHPGAAARRA